MIDSWNPAQYDKFQREREQPFFDLLAWVQPAPHPRVVDLGCGTGKLTRLLHERLDARETVGIDRSARMLESITAQDLPKGLSFETGTIESFPGGRGAFDVIVSNAAFHWVEDHETLFRRLSRALAPGGQLAFQVPAQHEHLSHRIAEELTTIEPFHSALGGWHRPQPVLDPEAYASLLYRIGFRAPVVHHVIYPHVLGSRDEVVEWMKGTLLTEYHRHLPADLFERFVNEYRNRLLQRLDDTKPFFFPFNRILCWGRLDQST